jgi:hypothetical protein
MQGCDQTADDDDGEGALRVRADGVGRGRGQQAQSRDQHGHHDGAQAEDGAFDGGVFDGVAAHAQLVDVFEHDDAGLHGDSEKGEEADAGGNAEVRAGDQEARAGRRWARWRCWP